MGLTWFQKATAFLDPLSESARQGDALPALRGADAPVAPHPEPHGLDPVAALGVLALELAVLLAPGGSVFRRRAT